VTPDRQGFAALKTLRGPPSRRVGADRPAAWLPTDSKLGSQGLTPAGWGGTYRVTFLSVELILFFAGQALATCSHRG